MNNCYKIITRNNTNGLFENSIDATYIIYLEGNLKRLKNIEEQLANIKPTKKIHILVNKGWKKCNKSKYITNTAKDLVDCNITCFKHAKKHNYDTPWFIAESFLIEDEKADDIDVINYFLKNNIENKISFYIWYITIFIYTLF